MAVRNGGDPERHERLIAAARELLGAHGRPVGVRLDEVAARAGTTKATLYRYFPSKAALLAAAADVAEAGDGVARRDQILDAAAGVIAAHGLHGTSMERIATAAGVSAPALYWHFKNKDDLILALVARVAAGLDVAALVKALQPLPADQSLPVLIERVMLLQGERIELVRALLAEASGRPALAGALYARVIGPIWSRLADYLAAEAAAGRLRPGPPLLRVLALVGMITFSNLARRTFGERLALPPPAEAAAELAAIFLHGIQAPAALSAPGLSAGSASPRTAAAGERGAGGERADH